MYRSKKYLNFIRNRTPLIPGDGQTVPHHVKMLKGGGMGIKPPDTHTVQICDYVHRKLDSPGNSERSVFHSNGISKYCIQMQIFSNICDYLSSVHNMDGLMVCIDQMTDFMERNKL